MRTIKFTVFANYETRLGPDSLEHLALGCYVG